MYTLPDGNDVNGNEHLRVVDKSQLKSGSIEIAKDDRIAFVTGKYKHSVGYIKIVTAKGNIHEFGNLSGPNAEHEFTFSIGAKEQPVSVFCALDKIGNKLYYSFSSQVTINNLRRRKSKSSTCLHWLYD